MHPNQGEGPGAQAGSVFKTGPRKPPCSQPKNQRMQKTKRIPDRAPRPVAHSGSLCESGAEGASAASSTALHAAPGRHHAQGVKTGRFSFKAGDKAGVSGLTL